MVNPRFVIKAVLSGQRLNINVPLTVAGTVNYIGVEAKCTSEWDDCTVVCYLYQAGTGYTAQLGLIYDTERKLYYFPNAERLTLTAGEWAVWFVGVMAESGQETYRVTSDTRYFSVYPNPFASSIPPGDISLDEEALARATDAQNKANLLLDKYNAGELTGPQGEPGDPAEIGFVQASVDNTTGNPGCVVTVTENPENTYNMQFAFSGIKGAKGDTGATGPKGDTGATGAPGRDGTDGRDGVDGETIDDYILVQAEQPTSETNKMWLKPSLTDDPLMVPTMEELATCINTLGNEVLYNLPVPTIISGHFLTLDSGSKANSNKYAMTNQLIFGFNNITAINLLGTTYLYNVSMFDATGSIMSGAFPAGSNGYLGASGYIQGWFNIPDTAIKIGISFRRADSANLTSADVEAIVNALELKTSTDKTLTNTHEPADSSVTGNRITEISDITSKNIVEIPFVLYANKYVTENGVIEDAIGYNCTNYIDVSGYVRLKYRRVAVTGSRTSICMVYLDENKELVARQKAALSQPENGYLADLQEIFVPPTAKYAVFPARVEEATYGKFELYGLPKLNNARAINDAYVAIHDCTELMAATTTDAIYDLYNDLLTKYPQYVTKNDLSQDGLTMYEYVFSSPDYNPQSAHRSVNPIIPKPEILLLAGLHGRERSAVRALYLLCKDLCENSYSLSTLINSAKIRVIPVGSPSAFDLNSRTNENGVNINRNFNADWEPATESTPAGDYPGASAADQTETQIIQNWIDNHTDAVLFIDCHNSGYGNEISYLLGEQTEPALTAKKKYLMAINKIIPFWQNARGIPNTQIYAYTGGGNPGTTFTPGTSNDYARSKDILCFTLEGSNNVINTGDYAYYSVQVNAESLGNTLIGLEYLYSI